MITRDLKMQVEFMGGLIPSLLYCVFRCYLSNLMTFRISCRSLCKLMVDLLN